MYYIALYEEGHFCTYVGGAVQTLPEALEQLRATAKAIGAEETRNYYGYKFNRNGTFCALVILDRWDLPINIEEDEA